MRITFLRQQVEFYTHFSDSGNLSFQKREADSHFGPAKREGLTSILTFQDQENFNFLKMRAHSRFGALTSTRSSLVKNQLHLRSISAPITSIPKH